jgi:hypothetical protein
MASELIWPFVEDNDNPTVDSYLEWANGQTDEIYKLKFEQVKFLINIQYLFITNNINKTNNIIDFCLPSSNNKLSYWS